LLREGYLFGRTFQWSSSLFGQLWPLGLTLWASNLKMLKVGCFCPKISLLSYE